MTPTSPTPTATAASEAMDWSKAEREPRLFEVVRSDNTVVPLVWIYTPRGESPGIRCGYFPIDNDGDAGLIDMRFKEDGRARSGLEFIRPRSAAPPTAQIDAKLPPMFGHQFIDLMNWIISHAKKIRPDISKSLDRNKHMHTWPYTVHPELADAVTVNFINTLAASYGLDLALYAKDLAAAPPTGEPNREGIMSNADNPQGRRHTLAEALDRVNQQYGKSLARLAADEKAERRMTLTEAVAILNKRKHRGFGDWGLPEDDSPPYVIDRVYAWSGDLEDELTQFEAIAIAREYERDRAVDF